MKLILTDKKLIIFNREVNTKSVRDLIEKVLQADRQAKGDIYLLITSGGGDSEQAVLAYSVLKNSIKNKLITIAAGEVASAATIIYLAGHERLAYKNAHFYVHAGKYEANFPLQEAKSVFKSLQNIEDTFLNIYVKNSDGNRDFWEQLSQKSGVLNADEMINWHLAHNLIDD